MVSELQEFRKARSSVHAGASEGAQRASLRDPLEIWCEVTFVGPTGDRASMSGSAVLRAAAQVIDQTYTAALRAMGTDPIPLAGTEAWVEGDRPYWARLVKGRPDSECEALWGQQVDDGVDAVGQRLGLPRARLVPVPVKQETPS